MNREQFQSDSAVEIEALTLSLSQCYEELALMHRISDRKMVTREPRDFFTQLTHDVREIIEAEKLLVFWRLDESLVVDIPEVVSDGPLSLGRNHLEVIWDRLSLCASEQKSVLVDSNIDRPCKYAWPAPIRDIVSVPVCRNQRLVGALVGLNRINRPDFDSIDTKLLICVANEIGVFLDNYCLYRDLQELFVGSLRALTGSVDAKDPYTCGHSERVALIARHLAERLPLQNVRVNDVYLAGLLHDVGKIGIDEALLCKPGRLNDDEFDQIKKHPQIGADILRPIRQMELITRAVLSHHERFDGAGYPQGLSGQDIPMAGRIVMLADSFDAMISDRTYRKALPLSAAMVEIRRFSGTQFDPELSDAFLDSDLNQLVNQLETVPQKSPHHYAGIRPLETSCLPILN